MTVHHNLRRTLAAILGALALTLIATAACALWTARTTLDAGTIELATATATPAGPATYSTTPNGPHIDPGEHPLKPSDTITVSLPVNAHVQGTTATPALSLVIPDNLEHLIDASPLTFPPSAEPQDLTLTWTLTVPPEACAAATGDTTVNLSGLAIHLSTGTTWTHTTALDLAPLPVTCPRQGPYTVLTVDTTAPGCQGAAAITITGGEVAQPPNPTLIDWGDGTNEPATPGTNRHLYQPAGRYQITINGTYDTFGGTTQPTTTQACLKSVDQWDTDTGVTNVAWAFNNATNLTSTVQPPATATDYSHLFAGATTFTGTTPAANGTTLANWQTGHVLNMTSMFHGATAFNAALAGWDTSKVTSMVSMFAGASAFAGDLSCWDTSSLGTGTTAPAGFATGAARLILDKHPLWGSAGCSSPDGPRTVLTFDTMAPGCTDVPSVHISGGKVGAATNPTRIYWGDGTSTGATTGGVTHAYPTPGRYRATIVGTYNSFGAAAQTIARGSCLISVDQWDDATGATTVVYGFRNAANLRATVQPPASVKNYANLFDGAASFTGQVAAADGTTVSDWDTSAVTNMSFMFYNAKAFNQPIGTWDVSGVTTIASMFRAASTFNQDISAWNLAQMTTLSYTFQEAVAFNKPLGAWDTSGITTMASTFYKATSFNQDLGGWDTSNVTSMNSMFSGASAFDNAGNPSIGAWNTSAVTNMGLMFNNASKFARDLSCWDTTALTTGTTAPSSFATGAPLLTAAKQPRWGTRPACAAP